MGKTRMNIRETHERRLETVRNHPVIREIGDTLEQSENYCFADYVPLFKKLQHSDFFRRVIAFELGELERNPEHQLPHFGDQGSVRGWPILVTDHFTVGIGVYRPGDMVNLSEEKPHDFGPSGTLQARSVDLFMGILDAKDSSYALYELPEYDNNTPLPPTTRLQPATRKPLNAGDSLFLEAGKHVPAFYTDGGYVVYMEVSSAPRYSCVPLFDANTLKYCGLIGGDPKSSRIEFMTRLLVRFEHKEALPILRKLAQHRDHFVRWGTIRHALCLDLDCGLELARQALDDPHPHVRLAARKTLQQFNAA